ncbi:hypothetical protein TNCV_2393491 [Trichonephila clavipes]|nr:hypothetical protein TNCV_2393491 [Trichonephila clavipes]
MILQSRSANMAVFSGICSGRPLRSCMAFSMTLLNTWTSYSPDGCWIPTNEGIQGWANWAWAQGITLGVLVSFRLILNKIMI